MKNQLLLVIIGVICLLILLLTIQINLINVEPIGKNIENFDARIKGLTKKKCGEICTSVVNCQGFSYSDDNMCYLSKSPILGKSITSIFSDNYSQTDYRCNKSQPIRNETELITPEMLKRNSLYMCSDSEQGKYNLNIICENLNMEIGDLDEIDKIDIPNYKIITNLKWPVDKRDTLLKDTSAIDNFKVYEKSPDEYNGQYLFPHKCVSNIDELSCLKLCDVDNECIGVEWNPFYMKNKSDNSYEIYKNVCCPKIQISDIIPRRKEFENGNFYIKKHVDEFNKDYIYIVPKNNTQQK